jgi:hypothetical protein
MKRKQIAKRRYGRITPPMTACRHPEDQRIDARSMGHMDRWVCKACGYAHGFEDEQEGE